MEPFGMSDEEKKKIREQHQNLEKNEKQKKEDLKHGVAFKSKKENDEENKKTSN